MTKIASLSDRLRGRVARRPQPSLRRSPIAGPAVFLCLLLPLFSTQAAAPTEKEQARIVDIYYVTDRKREDEGADVAYGGGRGAVDSGRCAVTYSPIPVLNNLAPRLPFYVPGEFQDVRALRFEENAALYAALDRWLGGGEDRKLVLFVHGYSFDFERACRRAAALQDGLGPNRRVVLFTWPSEGDPTAYTEDSTDMEWSVPHLVGLISALERLLGSERVQIVAHSMGARGLVLALERLRWEVGIRAYAGELVLIAPDIDREIFLEHFDRIRHLAGPITLYASENDTPLSVSRQLHGYPRLGQAGSFLTVLEGMETIDVTPIGRYQITGHEYHYYHPRVAADLHQLLAQGRRAPERDDLEPRKADGRRYWSMQPMQESGPPKEKD